jgi:hypothetical protein
MGGKRAGVAWNGFCAVVPKCARTWPLLAGTRACRPDRLVTSAPVRVPDEAPPVRAQRSMTKRPQGDARAVGTLSLWRRVGAKVQRLWKGTRWFQACCRIPSEEGAVFDRPMWARAPSTIQYPVRRLTPIGSSRVDVFHARRPSVTARIPIRLHARRPTGPLPVIAPGGLQRRCRHEPNSASRKRAPSSATRRLNGSSRRVGSMAAGYTAALPSLLWTALVVCRNAAIPSSSVGLG